MRGRTGSAGFRLFGCLTVLVGAVWGGGLLLALPSPLGPATAGADTPLFNITCTGIPTVGTATFPTTITGSIPADIPNDSGFTVSGHQWLVTVPVSLTDDIDGFYGTGATVTSTVTTTINATGTQEGSESETVTFAPVTTPAPGNTFQMVGTPVSSPTFTGNGSNVSITPGVNISAFDIFVNSNPTTPFPCTTPTPSPVIAAAAGVHDPIAFVTDPGPNTVTPIDATSDLTDPSFPFNSTEPGDIAITPNGSTAYVSGVNSDAVNPINLATDTVGSTITVGNEASGLAVTPNGATVYVANSEDNTVTPIATATNTAGAPIPVGSDPVAVAVTPNGATAYVANSEDDTVTPIATATDTAGAPIPVGSDPVAVAVTPNGATAYVANSEDDTVTPIGTASNTAGAQIPVGSDPVAVAVTPNGATAYVANSEDDTVTPIGTASNTAGAQIPVGSDPNGVAVTPDGSTVEVITAGDNTVTPIATATGIPGTPTASGNDPWAIALLPDQAPVAALSVSPADAGQATSFNASASLTPSSAVTNYAWNFGDGATSNTSGPTTSHSYAHQGTYTATVTEVDAAGTSLTKVFTGQTMSRNGGPQAQTSSTFNVGVVTNDTCTVPGMGTVNFPTVLSELTAPPPSIDRGGTFQTALGAEVTVPATVINHFRNLGATSLTVGSQSNTEAGQTAGGAPSGAVTPNTESASATNLPQSDTTLLPGVPYTYETNYNPVTWQTGPGTGVVRFTPGVIDIAATFVVHGSPTNEAITCTPPHGAAALGSTTVNPPPSNPTFQVPSSTPPLQNQVSAGTDGGWEATIANTSTSSVTGLSASVSVTDGHGPLTFDLAGMAASGTNCSNAGSGKLTCSLASLGQGASDTLDVLVNTTGLLSSVPVSGSVTIASSQAGSHTTSLGTIAVVVVEAGNGTKAVATPGKALVSTKHPLKTARASVSLILPKGKIKITKKAGAERDGVGATASSTITVNPRPVAVTLETLKPSAEPALCPPTGSSKCEGNIVQVFGNFSLYTNKLHPISATVKFFYGTTVPKGTVYFLKPSGKKVDKLSTCTKTSAGYDTPCVFGKEVVAGTTGNKYAQDVVYFTGNDPAMGRR